MIRLLASGLSVALRGVVRARPEDQRWGWRLAGLASLIVMADVLLTWAALNPPAGLPTFATGLYGVSGVIVGCIGGGSVALSVEAARKQTGEVTAALTTLPLSRREMAVLDQLPSALLTLFLVVFLLPPVAGILSTALNPGTAIALATASVFSGLAATNVLLALIAVVLPGSRWSAVRVPLSMLLAAGLAALAVARALQPGAQAPTGGVLDIALVLPQLVHLAVTAGVPDAWLLIATSGAALFSTLVLTPLAKSGSWGSRSQPIRVSWTADGLRGQFQADLLLAFRDPTILANSVAAFLLILGASISTLFAEPAVASALAVIIALIGCVLAGSAVRMLRSLYSRTEPPQQLIGFGIGSFVGTQLGVSAVFFVAMTVPLALMIVDAGSNGTALFFEIIAIALAVYAVSALSAWAIPLDMADGSAQGVTAFVTSLIAFSIGGVVAQLVTPFDVLAGIGMVAIAIVVAARLEGRRWTSSSRLTNPNRVNLALD